MKKTGAILFVIGMFFSFASLTRSNDDESTVYTILKSKGYEAVNHEVNKAVFSSVELGRQIVHNGEGKVDGRRSRRQSKEFVCTSCHNTVKESDLFYDNPDSKLLFAKENNLAYTQATTFWGLVNRTSYYNGDYYKKYGEVVKDARHDLRKAIQLCAVQCAQGRPLKDWEIESVLAYMWTLQLNLSDIEVTSSELYQKSDQESVTYITSKYAAGAPATFDKSLSSALPKNGNPENGAIIYKNGCLHCHENEKYSFYSLDDTKITFTHLNNMLGTGTLRDVHFISRHGTLPSNMKKAYMPNYTLEKMSNQQLVDLMSYIREGAK